MCAAPGISEASPGLDVIVAVRGPPPTHAGLLPECGGDRACGCSGCPVSWRQAAIACVNWCEPCTAVGRVRGRTWAPAPTPSAAGPRKLRDKGKERD